MKKGHTKRFIPIGKKQIKRIWAIANKKKIDREKLYQIACEITGLPSISSMSRNEGDCLIKILLSPENKLFFPMRAPYPDEISGECFNSKINPKSLPHWYHIKGIREMALLYFDDMGAFRGWLKKYRKVENIRDMDIKNARDTFMILNKMTARKQVA